MSRETMADILVGEIYAATAWSDAFVPMDPRRVKRLAHIHQSTSWNDSETLNRLAGAALCSRDYRKANRK